MTDPAPAGALAPFRRRAFLWLWLGMLVASMATWMQTVGAQWLLVQSPNATLVALVQAATSLPMMLLALPSGVVSDAFDRRWLLVIVQATFAMLGVAMAVLTAGGFMNPPMVLILTVAWGAATAMQIPAWQATLPELVPRESLRAAVRLDMVSVNVSRALGPALAGFIIGRWGIPHAFATAAVLVLPLIGVLLAWRRPRRRLANPEPFLSAFASGGRYVLHEPMVRRILVRCFLFVLGGSSFWALLPLVASQRLGVDASGYGVMYVAVGIGAVTGAFGLARVKDALSTNGMLAVSSVGFAAALAGLVLLPGYWLVMVALVLAGLAWMGAVSTLNGDLALVLPVWVRARGLGINMIMFTGATVLGSLLWGRLTDGIGLTSAILIAAGFLLVTVALGQALRMPDTDGFDPAPVPFWGEADIAVAVDKNAGPVAVNVEYRVAMDRQADFLVAMDAMRRSRLRNGSTRWELWRDGADPTRFVEHFTIATWGEHLRQHETRTTAADEAVENHAMSFSDPPPRGVHLLPPGDGPPVLADEPLPTRPGAEEAEPGS